MQFSRSNLTRESFRREAVNPCGERAGDALKTQIGGLFQNGGFATKALTRAKTIPPTTQATLIVVVELRDNSSVLCKPYPFPTWIGLSGLTVASSGKEY